MVRAGFSGRRKMLRRSLSGLVMPEAFEAAGVSPTLRPEELEVQAWGRLAAAVRSRRRASAGRVTTSAPCRSSGVAVVAWRAGVGGRHDELGAVLARRACWRRPSSRGACGSSASAGTASTCSRRRWSRSASSTGSRSPAGDGLRVVRRGRVVRRLPAGGESHEQWRRGRMPVARPARLAGPDLVVRALAAVGPTSTRLVDEAHPGRGRPRWRIGRRGGGASVGGRLGPRSRQRARGGRPLLSGRRTSARSAVSARASSRCRSRHAISCWSFRGSTCRRQPSMAPGTISVPRRRARQRSRAGSPRRRASARVLARPRHRGGRRAPSARRERRYVVAGGGRGTSQERSASRAS